MFIQSIIHPHFSRNNNLTNNPIDDVVPLFVDAGAVLRFAFAALPLGADLFIPKGKRKPPDESALEG